MYAVSFADAGCWRSPTQPKLVKKIAAIRNEKIPDKDYLLRLGCAFCCDSVRATAGSAFDYARTSEPKFADACSTDIAHARNSDIAHARSSDIAHACSSDIAHACGYASSKST